MQMERTSLGIGRDTVVRHVVHVACGGLQRAPGRAVVVRDQRLEFRFDVPASMLDLQRVAHVIDQAEPLDVTRVQVIDEAHIGTVRIPQRLHKVGPTPVRKEKRPESPGVEGLTVDDKGPFVVQKCKRLPAPAEIVRKL